MQTKLEYWSIDRLVPYERNIKRHPSGQIKAIANSIQEFGFQDPIGVCADGEILEGHGRYMAAKQLGLKEVPVIVVSGLDNEKARSLYRIAHNQLTLTSGFDVKMLAELLQGLVASNEVNIDNIGFNASDMKHIMRLADEGVVTELAPPIYKYEFVFDTKEQLQKWNSFIRRLKTQSGVAGTHAGRLMEQINKSGVLSTDGK